MTRVRVLESHAERVSPVTAGVFDDHLDAWQREQESPWGRLRYSVVRHTLDRTIGGRLGMRALDLGGGAAADSARLAVDHDVTVHDFSAPLPARAQQRDPRLTTVLGDLDEAQGEWDLVLCHNVVQYRTDVSATVLAVADLVAPGGHLSLIAPNPAGEVIAARDREQDPARARALLDAPTAQTVTFQHEVRRVEADHVEVQLRERGLTTTARYGIRCANDLLADNARKRDPAFWAELDKLEIDLCDREPWVRTGRFWQLVSTRPYSTER